MENVAFFILNIACVCYAISLRKNQPLSFFRLFSSLVEFRPIEIALNVCDHWWDVGEKEGKKVNILKEKTSSISF